MNTRLMALRRAEEEGQWSEFYGNSDPKCPHCAATYSVSDNEAWELYSEGDHEVKCAECDLPFQVETMVTFRFSTESQDDQP